MSGEIERRYAEVLDRIRFAADRGGRDANVEVVAVSKTFPADVILRASEQGVTRFGENRPQELKEKFAVVGDRVRWDFVGHLQTNKVRHVVGVASLIHSVDRYGLAEAIDRRASSMGLEQRVLIEINIARDPKRHGVDPAQGVALAAEVASLGNVKVIGVMGMAPFTEDPGGARSYFQELRELAESVARRVPGADALSMGMTRDFEVAVEEGATIVRIGEAIFGPRRR